MGLATLAPMAKRNSLTRTRYFGLRIPLLETVVRDNISQMLLVSKKEEDGSELVCRICDCSRCDRLVCDNPDLCSPSPDYGGRGQIAAAQGCCCDGSAWCYPRSQDQGY